MRIEYTLALCGALLFTVGCDETQRSATYGTSSANYPTSYGTTYGTYETPKQAQVMQSSAYGPGWTSDSHW